MTGRAELAEPTLNAFMALGPEAWAEARAVLAERVPDADALPVDAVALHLPFGSATTSTSTPRSTTPPTSAGSSDPTGAAAAQLEAPPRRLPRPRPARSSSAVRRSSGPAGSARRPRDRTRRRTARAAGSTSRPSSGSWSASAPGWAAGSPSTRFADHVFGVVGLNDWCARDIQAWEYVPLGPFLGKSFATSVSAWVTPLAALRGGLVRPARAGPGAAALPATEGGRLGARHRRRGRCSNGEVVSRPPYRAHVLVARPDARPPDRQRRRTRTGDLFACGTISGPEPETRGSFLELSWGGREPFAGGRTFLEDGDEVTLRYSAPGTAGGRITLGEVTGRIDPARE